jgi:hypothetical protein
LNFVLSTPSAIHSSSINPLSTLSEYPIDKDVLFALMQGETLEKEKGGQGYIIASRIRKKPVSQE